MRFVVDTNQALELRQLVGLPISLTLSPYVLAEILLRSYPDPTLSVLSKFNVTVGLDTLDIVTSIAQSTATEIERFVPFPRPEGTYSQSYQALTELIQGGHREVRRSWAEEVKRHQRCSLVELREGAIALRAQWRESREIADLRYSSFGEVMADHNEGLGSFLPSLIIDVVSNAGKRQLGADASDLVNAVLANAYLGRWFRMWLAYVISISRKWRDMRSNFDPSPRSDDLTDITLAVYAGDGDVLATRDQRLKRLVGLVEGVGGSLRVAHGDSLFRLANS